MRWLVLLGCFVVSSGASAATGDLNVNLDTNVTVSRDTPVGFALKRRDSSYKQTIGPLDRLVRTIGTVDGILVPGHNNVYQTSMPGIGIRFFGPTWRSVASRNAMPYEFVETRPGPPHNDVGLQIRGAAELVVTGQIQPGKITSFPTATLRFIDERANREFGRFKIRVSSSPVIAARACSVKTPNIRVDMPKLSVAAIGAVGEGAGRRPFDIRLSCDADVNVHTTLTDATSPGNRSSLLALTEASTARGVGYRVLHNGVPVQLGPASPVAGTEGQFFVSRSGNGTLNVPLEAEYVATGAVTPGSADANALFTMSYQ
ncbi:fimbrial protein [Burkholderia semiarida]|uniref:Fimbrial protein n=1 Tax=Burkholderia semiarida TaxID=2843303 RepID=A0ABW7L8Z1_9BURK